MEANLGAGEMQISVDYDVLSIAPETSLYLSDSFNCLHTDPHISTVFTFPLQENCLMIHAEGSAVWTVTD